jgi:hypothetical protein
LGKRTIGETKLFEGSNNEYGVNGEQKRRIGAPGAHVDPITAKKGVESPVQNGQNYGNLVSLHHENQVSSEASSKQQLI